MYAATAAAGGVLWGLTEPVSFSTYAVPYIVTVVSGWGLAELAYYFSRRTIKKQGHRARHQKRNVDRMLGD
jgi:hypothetical protein